MKIICFVLGLALSTPALAEPTPQAVATARLRQEEMPELKRRAEAAGERAEAAAAYFSGDAELAATWPELQGAPLLSLPYVQGQLARLDAREEARIAERLQGPDAELREPDQKRWRAARDKALDAEADADAMERRLWVGLSMGLKAAPLLREQALDAQAASWRDAVSLPAPEDPGYAAAAEVAAQAGELEIILSRYRDAAVRGMTVPEDLSLVRLVTVDLTRQSTVERSPMQAEAAADRMRRVQPLLPAALSAEVQGALDAREIQRLDGVIAELEGKVRASIGALMAQDRPPEGVPRAALEAEAQATQVALEAVQDETAAVLMAPEPPAGAALKLRRRQVAQLRLEQAELRASLAAERLRLVPPEQVRTAEDGALRTQAQVDDAQRKAEEARRKAVAAGKERLQALAEALSALSDRIANAELQRQNSALSSIQELEEGEAARRAAIAQAEAAPPAMRREALRTAYVNQLAWMSTLRRAQREREADVRRLTVDNLRIRREEIPAADELVQAADADAELVGSVQETIDAILQTLVERREQALREQDQVTGLLIEARQHKRALRERLPASDRAAAERAAEVDPVVRAVDELLDEPMVFAAQYRQMRDTDTWSFRGMTRRLLSLVFRSLEVVVVLLGWYVLRQRGAVWVEQLLRFIQQVAPRGRSDSGLVRQLMAADLTGLAARLAPVIQPGADVLASLIVHRLVSTNTPLIGLLTLLWLMRAALRLVRPLLELLVVTDTRTPFALLRTSADSLQRIRRTVRLLTWWWLASVILRYIAYDILHTDFFADRVADLLSLVLFFIVLRELLRWAPTVQQAVKERGGESRLFRWMTEDPDGRIVAVLRSGVGIAYLLSLIVSRGITFLVEGRGGFSWIGSLIAQHSLKEVDRSCPPISDAERAAIFSADRTGSMHAAEVEQIRAAHQTWCGDQRRGLVALIGDRGAGKTQILDELADLGASNGRVTARLSLPARLTTKKEALDWLREGLGLADGKGRTWRGMRAALMEQPGQVILIDDLHRLLLRAVGGFTVAREILDLMHATGMRHFWVCSFHGPTWAFLDGTAVPINLEVFRTRVRVAPLDPAALSEWVTAATREAGFDFRFDNLAAAGVRTADLGRELIRVESVFWRRLNDVSLGNPQIAFRYWIDSLRHAAAEPEPEPTPDPADAAAEAEAAELEVAAERKMLDVALIEPPDTSQLEVLPDIDLFVLTAILIHDGLSVALLSRSLNAPPGQMRSVCRHLESLQVLRTEGRLYRIRVPWRPAVARLLRQKHFLHQR